MLHQQDCEDGDEVLELRSSVYDQLGTILASMTTSTDTEAATGMNALSMDLPEAPVGNLLDTRPNLQIQILPVHSVQTVPPHPQGFRTWSLQQWRPFLNACPRTRCSGG